MVDYLEILRLHSIQCSQRAIAASTHISRNTISTTLVAARNAGIEWPNCQDMTNAELRAMLFPEKYSTVEGRMMPDFKYIYQELVKPGVTLSLLWSEYCDQARSAGQIPYMYTQFCEKYRKWARISKATMRIQHKPGEKIEVDWAGKTISVYDSVTGAVTKAYLFVAVLPCSCYTYAEATGDMKMETWIACHVHAFAYFGGVARLLAPDNLKTGVTTNTRYDTLLTRSYYEMAEYYETAVVPCRVKHPKDKSHAEGAVSFATTWIIAALRNEKFFTVDEVRRAVEEKLEILNTKPFKERPGCRRDAFLNEEKEFMRPLPVAPYEIAVWRVAKVRNDYLVTDGLNKYSVPFDLIGEQVDIRLTTNTVEVFFKGALVASHLRASKSMRDPIVNPDHMPEEHRKYLNYNEEDFLEWAEGVGKYTYEVVYYFLHNGRAPEQGYKPCATLTKLVSRYGKKRVEQMCERVMSLNGNPSIRLIVTGLKCSKEANASPEVQEEEDANKYGITRGMNYFCLGGKEDE